MMRGVHEIRVHEFGVSERADGRLDDEEGAVAAQEV